MSYLNDLIDAYDHNNRPEEPVAPLSIWTSQKDKSENSEGEK